MPGDKFRRQYSVAAYVVDFYCPTARLAIEVDGDSHFQRGCAARDETRQAAIESSTFCVSGMLKSLNILMGC